MKNLEPKIYRQRLVIEGHYQRKMDEEVLREYLKKLSDICGMKIFAGPYSWPPDPLDNPKVTLTELNGFVAWTKSGCHAYVFRFCKFFTVDIYSCATFNTKVVVAFTKKFFTSKDIVHKKI